MTDMYFLIKFKVVIKKKLFRESAAQHIWHQPREAVAEIIPGKS